MVWRGGGPEAERGFEIWFHLDGRGVYEVHGIWMEIYDTQQRTEAGIYYDLSEAGTPC